jgi:hypothetical protein
MQERLTKLGVYVQPDDSIAVSDYLPKHHVEDLYLVKFHSLKECIEYLEKNVDEIQDNFIALWKSFEQDCVKSLSLEKVESKINDKIVVSALNALIGVAQDYEACNESYHRLIILRKNLHYINDKLRRKLTYYATLIDHSEAEMIEESMRVEDITMIIKLHKEAGSIRMMKEAYHYGNWGLEEGIGPRGKNNPMTPFSNFDYYYDRVMDGREIGEGKGHATEKFKTVNRFKRKPHLNMKKRFKYRTKPLRYISKKLKRLLNRKKKKKDKKGKGKKNYSLKSNGLVYVDMSVDPTYIYWWDQQRNNPYLYSERGLHGTYPTWDTYK